MFWWFGVAGNSKSSGVNARVWPPAGPEVNPKGKRKERFLCDSSGHLRKFSGGMQALEARRYRCPQAADGESEKPEKDALLASRALRWAVTEARESQKNPPIEACEKRQWEMSPGLESVDASFLLTSYLSKPVRWGIEIKWKTKNGIWPLSPLRASCRQPIWAGARKSP